MTGKNVRGQVVGPAVVLDHRRLFEEQSIKMDTMLECAEQLRHNGQTVMFVAVDNHPAGLLGVAGPIKASIPEAIERLHQDGVELIMLTDDNRTTAVAVAHPLYEAVRSGLKEHELSLELNVSNASDYGRSGDGYSCYG